MTNPYADKTALVTGANSGLGFEAAAQLAEAGFGRVILACRTLDKAAVAKTSLSERAPSTHFDSIAVDLADLSSSKAAADELIRRAIRIDALLLNAGLASGDQMQKSADGLELSFASSIIGHHVIATRLRDAGMFAAGARIVMVGSEAANGNLPAMMGMTLYDFATRAPTAFGDDLRGAMLAFARGERPELFNGTHYYATTKAFSAWWSAAMARRYGREISVFTVSPGANMGTNAARNVTGFKHFLYAKVMPSIGGWFGMNMPTAMGAKRYLDVLLGDDADFQNGGTYTSRPKKLVGPLHLADYAHLVNLERQEAAWDVLAELSA